MTLLGKVSHCKDCPSFETGQGRCTAFGTPLTDLYVLGGPPTAVEVANSYTAFSGESSVVYRNIFLNVKKTVPEYMKIKVKYHHATHCFDPKINTEVVHHCSSLVKNEIYSSNPKALLILGTEAMKSLGIKGTLSEMRGQELLVSIGNRDIPAVISFAPGALVRKENAGKLPTAKHDMKMALSLAAFGMRKHKTIAELTQGYTTCRTPAEFTRLVDMVLEHPADLPDGTEGPCEKNLLALDTETAVENNLYSAINTWVPGFKMIAASVSWAHGKSAAVLLDHKLNVHEYNSYKADLKRLLDSPNPKTFHNYKYDYKVLTLAKGFNINNVMYDSQFGEYLLDENKAGEYGLKKITKNRVPEFYGYEKELKSASVKAEELMAQIIAQAVKLGVERTELKAQQKHNRSEVKDINASIKLKPKKTYPEERAELEAKKILVNERIADNKARQEGIKSELEAKKKDVETCKQIIDEQKDISFEDMDVDVMLKYAAIDTDITRRISKQQIAEIKQQGGGLFKALTQIMLPAVKPLAEMEHVGIKIDLEYMEELRVHFEKVIEETRDKVYQKIGREINLNSARDIISVLTVDYGIKLTKQTKSKQFSTDAAVLESLAKEHEIAAVLLEYKRAHRIRHSMLKGIMTGGKSKHDYGCSIDGRIHGNYNQTIAATGRLSSSAPNLQNIPYMALGKNIKKMFVPDNQEEQVMVQVDYSAAEVRVLTAYAPDPELIKVLNSGLDMHSFVGSQVFEHQGIYNSPGVTYDQLKNREELINTNPKEFTRLDTMRQISKMVMFLTIYGGGAYTLQGNLEKAGILLTQEECEAIMQLLLKKFPAISKYMRTIKNTVSLKGEVETYLGRKRRFPIARFSFKMRKAAYREAINAPIQGTSSDIVLHQMYELWEEMNTLGYTNCFRGTVHDSIFFQFPKKDLHKLEPLLDEYIQGNVRKNFKWMPVDFAYDVEFGPSYGEAKTNLKKVDFSKELEL